MPEKDGYDFLRTVQYHETLQNIPVVIVSCVQEVDTSEFQRNVRNVPKPISNKALLSVLREELASELESVLLVEDDPGQARNDRRKLGKKMV